MNREDIIAMAREAGFAVGLGSPMHHKLERFAALVAATVEQTYITAASELIPVAVAAEREACAKVCENAPEPDGRDLAERIRARGETK